MKHPRDMGAPQIEAFLAMLATQRKVSASTHKQALSALLFLYREVVDIELPWQPVGDRTSLRKIGWARTDFAGFCSVNIQNIHPP